MSISHQITGMAGEFLVAGKLFKHGLQVSVTLGNAKSIDLLANNPETGRNYNIQVKSLRAKNCFPMKKESVNKNHFYVFVLLNKPDEEEEFYIVPGNDLINNIDHFFGNSYQREQPSNMPAINYGPLKEYRNNWSVFHQK